MGVFTKYEPDTAWQEESTYGLFGSSTYYTCPNCGCSFQNQYPSSQGPEHRICPACK